MESLAWVQKNAVKAVRTAICNIWIPSVIRRVRIYTGRKPDPWRDEAWQIMHMRPDVKFFLLTKRPECVADHLPADWGDGWENIMYAHYIEGALKKYKYLK